MIINVNNKRDLKKFAFFVKTLYKDDPYYVYPIFRIHLKELQKVVLIDNDYTALICVQDNIIVGRLLFTYAKSKKQAKTVCYYSHFDSINDDGVVSELFQYMETDMKQKGVTYSEGTFSPFDPDTRRGIMVKGFNELPSLFTSYNYEYYGTLLENYGFKKAIDTVLINADVNEKTKKRLNTFSKFFLRSNDVRIDSLNKNQLEADFKDVETILKKATNEVNYQDAPDIDLIRETARQMKMFLNYKFVKIARDNKTNEPIGFCLVVPDFNQVLIKTKGKIKPLTMLYLKRKITKARGQMQYIVPAYQNGGLIGHMFKVVFDDFVEAGITEFEAGTMMENNPKPINAFKKFGGDIIKIYRLYGKEVSK